MPQQITTSVENNFTRGLITEATGLNFPENAATAANNCTFTLIGDTVRREGIDFETGFTTNTVSRSNNAISTYKWNNAGGDGLTQLVVTQIGPTLYFYRSSSATTTSPISNQLLVSTVNASSFTASTGTFDVSQECQYADGNGYLFVYHPSCDPFYCTYTAGTITGAAISVQIRDFIGIPDHLAVTTRPNSLSAEHSYNLSNQGWTSGSAWVASSSSSIQPVAGAQTFTVAAGLAITGGDTVNIVCTDPSSVFYIPSGTVALAGTVSSYVGTSLTITCTYSYGGTFTTRSFSGWIITQTNLGHINSWVTAIGNYPSNADVWWYFKDTTNVFNPTTMAANVTISSTNAPQGHFVLNAFNQQRGLVSGVSGLTSTVTTARPRTGTWFQGRVWYTGVDAQQPAIGDAPYYTWTESIYFSQIVQTPADFGQCYQQNDPTSQNLFGLLPTDGGVIVIQGCGSIYKLFPIQNGMLVFAANGVWFITGSQGIGFSADDYTITKISNIQSISSTSFINVMGLPYFWNEEGIYSVQPQQGGGLSVEPITVGTILTYYNNIPASSKKYVRGDYHPIDYTIQWIFRSTPESNVTQRYAFDSILNYNVYNKSFFPYTVDTTKASINSILYVNYPNSGVGSPDPGFKYLSSAVNLVSFADEHDTTYVDWLSQGGTNYVSSFTTGYKLRGQGIKKFQPQYILIYCRTNGAASGYKIQSKWDYSNDPTSGKWTDVQLVSNQLIKFDTTIRRHKIRGRGYAIQFSVQSSTGLPFDIQGWAIIDTVNTGA